MSEKKILAIITVYDDGTISHYSPDKDTSLGDGTVLDDGGSDTPGQRPGNP